MLSRGAAISTPLEISTLAALVVRRSHGGGAILLIVIVLVALGYGLFRAAEKRRISRPGGSRSTKHTRGVTTDNGAATLVATPTAAASQIPSAPAAHVAPRPPVTPPQGWAVETHHLTKRFGQNLAVDDVELLVPRGCAFGYLGPNGAGKTTLMRTLLGLTHADGGTMELLGIPVPKDRAHALKRVGAIVDEPRFHAHLSGRENMQILAAARGSGADTRIDSALHRVGLEGRGNDRVGSYSMGMRQRLGVASCLLGDPELLILDEPMNGLDPAGMQEMRAIIKSLVDEGRTVMLSSHLLDEVERTCDALAIVDHGRVIQQGPIVELLRGAGGVVVRVDCSAPEMAVHALAPAAFVVSTAIDADRLSVTLPEEADRAMVAEINRLIVESGVAVYRLEEVRTTLEDWFLAVTSRLGDPS